MKYSKLLEAQNKFSTMIARLILYAQNLRYYVTCGDFYATSGHIVGSKHYIRLAADLNLFKDGKYLKTTFDHYPLGLYWEKRGGIWGGRFKNPDGNHYEIGFKNENI